MRKMFSTFILASIVLPYSAAAAISYSRNPSTNSFVGPLTVSATFNNQESDLEISAQDAFWGVGAQNAQGVSYYSSCVPVTNLSNSFVLNLPPGNSYLNIFAIGGRTLASCQTAAPNSPDSGGVDFEGNGTSAIFEIPGSVETPTFNMVEPIYQEKATNMNMEEKKAKIADLKIKILKLQIEILKLQIQQVLENKR